MARVIKLKNNQANSPIIAFPLNIASTMTETLFISATLSPTPSLISHLFSPTFSQIALITSKSELKVWEAL